MGMVEHICTPALRSLRQKEHEFQELVRKKEVEQEKGEEEAGRGNNKIK